jgi:hypothetical protein
MLERMINEEVENKRAPKVMTCLATIKSAVGATEVSPARKGWERKSTRSACRQAGFPLAPFHPRKHHSLQPRRKNTEQQKT